MEQLHQMEEEKRRLQVHTWKKKVKKLKNGGGARLGQDDRRVQMGVDVQRGKGEGEEKKEKKDSSQMKSSNGVCSWSRSSAVQSQSMEESFLGAGLEGAGL